MVIGLIPSTELVLKVLGYKMFIISRWISSSHFNNSWITTNSIVSKACFNAKSDAYCEHVKNEGNCTEQGQLEDCRKTCEDCNQSK